MTASVARQTLSLPTAFPRRSRRGLTAAAAVAATVVAAVVAPVLAEAVILIAGPAVVLVFVSALAGSDAADEQRTRMLLGVPEPLA